MKKLYQVKELAKLSGVTVRTLHHYDRLGLLVPQGRSEAGYRLYGEDQLFRLQQILFYKELEMPLPEIKKNLDRNDFDLSKSLRIHQEALLHKKQRLEALLGTLAKTLDRLEGKAMVTDKELYEGFDQDQIARYEREVRASYDPKLVAQSKKRLQKLTKSQWQEIKEEGTEISRGLAEALKAGLSADSAEAQAWVQRHFCWLNHFYTPTKEVYLGLAELYVENPEFTAHYEAYAPGLAQFLRQGMNVFAQSLP